MSVALEGFFLPFLCKANRFSVFANILGKGTSSHVFSLHSPRSGYEFSTSSHFASFAPESHDKCD